MTWGQDAAIARGVPAYSRIAGHALRKSSTLLSPPAAVDAEFSSRVTDAEQAVRVAISRQSLTQDQYDALVSYTYNLGPRGAAKALEFVNDGNFEGAVTEMTSMIRVKVKTKRGIKSVIAHGLVNRRAEESAPFRK